MARSDKVSEDDLHAYIDDQLDVARRIEVETYLAERPTAAAQVMADLRNRHELRMALVAEPGFARPATEDAARRIEGALRRHAWAQRFRPAIAATVLVTAGWFAHAQFAAQSTSEAMLPGYVEAALNARQASLLRAAMYSQPEAPDYDRAELLSATAITMPELPADWIVTDVQVFPSQFGPSIEMAIQAEPYGSLSLFSARPGHFAVSPVTTAQMGDVAGAYWQIGEIAYALLGDERPEILGAAATGLAHTLY
ncbi:anti-sigma factor family protein [Devosia sp. A449]